VVAGLGLADVGLLMQDDDLWIMEPLVRFELEGEPRSCIALVQMG
jgi:hypothetical protein